MGLGSAITAKNRLQCSCIVLVERGGRVQHARHNIRRSVNSPHEDATHDFHLAFSFKILVLHCPDILHANQVLFVYGHWPVY